MNIYVGDLSPEVNEEELRQEFARFEEATSVTLVENNQSRYGFLVMPLCSQGQVALERAATSC